MTDVRILTEPLGGGPLARAGWERKTPAGWYEATPDSPDGWRARAIAIRESTPGNWLEQLSAALQPAGAARDRIERSARGQGIVVTTGQQPGLFGGPLYTWTKAVGALALADELEAATGIPCAPVFWAATDDSDYDEASHTVVSLQGGAEHLRLPPRPADGVSMSSIPLGDVSDLLARVRSAAGSAADLGAIEALERAYQGGATLGSAYVALLRELLHPLGISVLDASHAAVSSAEDPLLRRALERAAAVADALVRRGDDIYAAGFEPQVAHVDGRSCVFARTGAGARDRVPVTDAPLTQTGAAVGSLSPNVLLRPVAEQCILPTVAYVAGPGEYAYFAQVSAVAEALGAPLPLAVPRWSATLVEPHVDELLVRYAITAPDVAAGDALAGRLAAQRVPEPARRAVATARDVLSGEMRSLRDAVGGADPFLPSTSVDGVERAVAWRLDRFERRLTAAAKRREQGLMHDLGTLRGALYPGGVRQERVVNIIPILARHGVALLARMRDAARAHARALVTGATPQA